MVLKGKEKNNVSSCVLKDYLVYLVSLHSRFLISHFKLWNLMKS